MTTNHTTFTIDRTYAATPARVFQAWANPAFKAKWFNGPDEWASAPHTLDFRVGGRESLAGGPKGGQVHRYDALYFDIVPNQRIVHAYDMHIGDNRISVSLATVELAPAGSGTRLVYTEQAVFLDGFDDAGSRERGTRDLFDKLEAALKSQ
ncbi:MAG: putative glutathione S-transferase-related transrane protein [Myxococcales bacterium]|nr:putative glutathione S-transferase-related transrane protein [Myxococcales bacterium]